MKEYEITMQDERGNVCTLKTAAALLYGTPIQYGADNTNPDGVKAWRVIACAEIGASTPLQVGRVYRLHGDRNIIAVLNNGDTVEICPEAFEAIADGNNAQANEIANSQARAIRADIKREEEREKEAAENRETCKQIAEELEAAASGSGYKCPHCGSLYTFDEYEATEHENEDGETLYTCPHCSEDINEYDLEAFDLYNFFADVYNIEYRIDSNGEYNSVEIMVACGGPNIYIDTERRVVVLRWWGNSAEYPIECADEVDDIVREWWEALRA